MKEPRCNAPLYRMPKVTRTVLPVPVPTERATPPANADLLRLLLGGLT